MMLTLEEATGHGRALARKIFEESLKRLEGEQRSLEGCAVPPGEAEPAQRVILTLEDGEDGTLTVKVDFEPEIHADTESNAVRAALLAIEEIKAHS